MKTLVILTTIISFVLAVFWYQKDVYVDQGVCFVALPAVKRAMIKIGNKRNFKMLPDGRLYVELSGEWKRLKY